MDIRKAIDCKDEFVNMFRDNSIIPIVGSGVSAGAAAEKGIVPSGKMYLEYMVDVIDKVGVLTNEEMEKLKSSNFSEIATIYEDDDIVSKGIKRQYFKDFFSNARFTKDDVRKSFFDIGWPYIYSLNVDDVIENSTDYDCVILPNRDFNEDIFDEKKCVIKLHGDVKDLLKYNDSSKVFTAKEYASSFSSNRKMLKKLASDYGNVNILFMGCSLDDEVDLLALESINIQLLPNTLGAVGLRDKNTEIFKKNYLFLTQEPSVMEKSKYKKYGITDIVLFEDYNTMYTFLIDAWKESQKVSVDELDRYTFLSPAEINQDSSSNADYLYMALNLVDYSKGRISYPYFMIPRECIKTLMEGIEQNIIQIVSGQRFSGKSYVLAYLYKVINDRIKYFFDARTRLTDKAIRLLLEKKNALMLFDADSLQRDQLEYILTNYEKISSNKNSLIIMVNSQDTELKGFVQMLTDDGTISSKAYKMYEDLFGNSFTRKELMNINTRLPEIRLQPYTDKDTLINYLMNISGEERIKTKYSDKIIPRNNVKEIAFSIAIASNEALYYSDIVNLEFEDIIGDIIRECSPLIEKLPTKGLERNHRDMSRVKVVLNSKYWIRTGLYKLANEKTGFDEIIRAYRYLIERLIDYSKEDLNRRRNKYKKIIYFDTINDIFGGKDGGKRGLVAQIYSNLNDLLGTDYQYNHQRAKCLMRNAFYQKNKSSKEASYSDAYKSAQIAWKQVQNEYDLSHNEKLLISLAHIEYSIASISASICDLHDYESENEIEDVIDKCYRAIINPYNEDDFYRDKKQNLRYGITFFVRHIMDRNLNLHDVLKTEYEELVKRMLNN